MSVKIVINTSVDGFALSDEAKALYPIKDEFDYYCGMIDHRTVPEFIAVIEALGDLANGPGASLKVVEIPDDVLWEIVEQYGKEAVHEKHRVWE